MKKTDDNDAEPAADDESERNDGEADESPADDNSPDLPNRGERPDNLRRRSEWFQKRTGGR